MIHFHGSGILLDIEGTTSSISFVHDVLFPFARQHLADFLSLHWDEQAVREACARIAQDAKLPDASQAEILAEAYRLMDRDAKDTGLKTLQGLIWDEGFRGGRLQSHLFDDVLPALHLWNERGFDVRIFSSGSIQAQKAFFKFTPHGDLLDQFRGHYDTTIGSKRESASYRRIAADMGLPADKILFLSDVPAELDAARSAGMQTGLAIRPGNAPAPAGCDHPTFRTFAEVIV